MAWDWDYVATGVWWNTDDDWYSFNYVTEVHEVDHAQGRLHSPGGGAANLDPDYPNADGALDTWGFGIVDDRVLPGLAGNFDYMSYEYEKAWSSVYTWTNNAQYIAAYQNWDQRGATGLDVDESLGFGDASHRAKLRSEPTMLLEITRPDGSVSRRAIHGGFEPELANSQDVLEYELKDGRVVLSPAWTRSLDGGVQHRITRMPGQLAEIRRIIEASTRSHDAVELDVESILK